MATTKLGLPTISDNMSADVVRDMNALAEAIDAKVASNAELQSAGVAIQAQISGVSQTITTHKNDYEYQTPVIVGTQIRLTKQSNTNRLFFILDSALNGTITISTDNGLTSKNLVDIEGNQVTSLDKGFVEVVAVSNFFILRNSGLSESDLQQLIAIANEAESNDSVLKTNYINAVESADDSISLPSDASWSDILLQIPNINAGQKRWATGVSTGNLGVITVTGLPFSPSFVLWRDVTVPRGGFAHKDDGFSFYLVYGHFTNSNNSEYAEKANFFKEDGFSGKVNYSSSNEVRWYAFE